MKIILDECVPKRLKQYCGANDVSTVREMGWASLVNGELTKRMTNAGVEVFITIDKNLRHQQNVAALPFGIIVLDAKTNRLPDILPLIPSLLRELLAVQVGKVVEIKE